MHIQGTFPRIDLRQLGQYDASFDAAVAPDGTWRTDGGSYLSRGGHGTLSRRAHRELAALAQAIDLDARHPQPDDAFVSRLAIGDRTVAWWGPPPTAALRALTTALAGLGRSA